MNLSTIVTIFIVCGSACMLFGLGYCLGYYQGAVYQQEADKLKTKVLESK